MTMYDNPAAAAAAAAAAGTGVLDELSSLRQNDREDT